MLSNEHQIMTQFLFITCCQWQRLKLVMWSTLLGIGYKTKAGGASVSTLTKASCST